MTDHASKLPPPRFEALAEALLGRIDSLVHQWLPGGVERNNEYFVHSVWRAEKTPSLSIKMSGERAGSWRDHGGDEAYQGGDLISLYGKINNLSNTMAAVELARELGLEDVAGVRPARDDGTPKPPRPAPVQVVSPPKPKPDEGWRTVMPVPAWAPEPNFWHQYRNGDTHKDPIDHKAEYRIDGALYGYVIRFLTSDGGKETLPHTWCVSGKDGTYKWHWKQFDEPRPLYFPGGVSPLMAGSADGSLPTVIVVEGEKKAGILQALLGSYAPDVYVVASWPGGSKAWHKANWEWMAGCTVILWPDCDGKREMLTKKERDALDSQVEQQLAGIGGQVTEGDRKNVKETVYSLAQSLKPLLPADKQVGMKAMVGIGALLRDTQACSVSMLPIPGPLEVEDGWDCADAIVKDGWDGERVLEFFGRAQPLVTPAPDSPSHGDPGKPVAHAGGGGGDDFGGAPANAEGAGANGEPEPDADAFADHLDFIVDSLKLKGRHEIGVNRKLLIAALRKAPSLCKCLGYNELTGAPGTRYPWPWRNVAGPLKDTDDLALGDYICSKYKLKPASRASLSEAIETVADQNRYHPVKDWLQAQKWDRKVRLDEWLIYVLGMDPETLQKAKLPPLQPKRKRYLELVGRYLLIGLVARVMQPGCKFDYSPVFEGLPGVGKSTFVKTLVGAEFFSDTHFDIGNGKDGFEQLEGLWGYELSELTALRKADSEQVKQFFSSTVDRFRGAYGKYVQAHPRQCVIFCSTNKKQYLYDLTGNRRFWPIWIDQPIKLAWLKERRGQLFAEALAAYVAGDVYAPSREDEQAYFEPEQKLRLVETAVQSRLYELLTREGVPKEEGKLTLELCQHLKFVTLDRLVSALGADAAKSSSMLEGQVRGWLESHGWEYGRESTGQRRRGYKQPAVWPPKIDDDAEGATAPQTPANAAGTTEGGDDEPF